MAKMRAQKGKLTPTSFQKLIKKVYKDPELKGHVISELRSLGVLKFAEKYFILNNHQKKELSNFGDRDTESVFTNSIISTLHRNGPIEYVHEGHVPPNMRVEFYGRYKGGIEVGVRITC
jgi:hypothetical protein